MKDDDDTLFPRLNAPGVHFKLALVGIRLTAVVCPQQFGFFSFLPYLQASVLIERTGKSAEREIDSPAFVLVQAEPVFIFSRSRRS